MSLSRNNGHRKEPIHTTAHVSCFRGAYDPIPTAQNSLAQVLHTIVSDTCKHQIMTLRNTLHRHGKAIYDCHKKLLNAFTPCGMFAPTRAKHHLRQHSGLVALDFDGVRDVAGAKQVLCGVPGVVYIFTSPSGCGLKAGVHVAQVTDDASYKYSWKVVADHFEHQYGLEADRSGSDISRLSFVSWDPQAYINLDADVFPILPMPVPLPQPPAPAVRYGPISTPGNRREAYLQPAITRAIALINSSRPPTQGIPGTRHHNRLKAARLLGGYVAGGFLSFDEAYTILARVVRDNTMHFDKAMRTIAGGLRYGERSPVTYEDLEEERLAWCAARGYTTAQREGH
jgi:VirE N-terminal domain